MGETASIRLLGYCGSLAAGEYLASFAANYAELGSAVCCAAGLVALFGYGFAVRGWSHAALALFGAALFLLASGSDEQLFRERPWLRDRPRRVSREAASGPSLARRVRAELSRRVGRGLPRGDEAVSLSRAILLGERWRLSPEAKRLFVESGTMHVFAISGLHVMAVAEVFGTVLMLAFVPRRLCGLLSVPLLWSYVAVIGWAPSAVRAAVMATFTCLAPLFWRRASGLRSWSLAFLLIHLADPRLIVNVGNALSFVVMLAIVLVGDWARDCAAWKRGLLVTFAAWAVGVPISAHVFGRVTPGSLVANLVLIGAARVTVKAGAVGVLASGVSDTLAAHVNNLSALSVRAMVLVAEAVARLPGANFETGSWPLGVCAVWYLGLVGLGVAVLRVRARRLAI